MKYTDVFKMPKATTIMARTSSITNSFVNGIIPCIAPAEEEIKRVLNILRRSGKLNFAAKQLHFCESKNFTSRKRAYT